MLSKQQEQAVRTTANKVLVAAAAGSGKTRVIIEHIKYLLETGERPENIYAITYTNMAAQEMLERLNDAPVFIGTIHSLANKILKSNNIDTSGWIEEQSFDKLLEVTKQKNIELPVIEHLLVDEFQDICDNEAEFIIDTLGARNIFLVGDSCQSIYGFKGGNYQHFINFKDNRRTIVYELGINYRNGSNILNYANTFLRNMDDVYRVNSIPGPKNGQGEVGEEEYSLSSILEHISEDSFGDWFVLGRTNAQVNEILNYLERNKIPCSTFKKSEKTYNELKDEFLKNTVKVLTIHSAKGLEAKNVIVVGLQSFNSEEKRVAYVACTRARERLIIMKTPKRGQRAKLGMYDDAVGEVVDFSKINTYKTNRRFNG